MICEIDLLKQNSLKGTVTGLGIIGSIWFVWLFYGLPSSLEIAIYRVLSTCIVHDSLKNFKIPDM